MADLSRSRHRIIAYWLFVLCAMVFVMIVLGGVTRLTHSGLSMVEWKPLRGWLPPLNEGEWNDVFAKYKLFPEYFKENAGMTLAEFKSIFWLEFMHRLWGRIIGVVFFIPFVIFFAKGWVGRELAPKLIAAFILGGLQGVLGWYMVKSGLVDRPDVSQYRLTAHLGAALVIYGYMFWLAIGLLRPTTEGGANVLRRFAAGLAAFAFLTILSGGFVAGLDAGFGYNTFPTMDGDFIPPGLLAMEPAWINLFENPVTVQFDHRLMAEAFIAGVLVFWFMARRRNLTRRQHLAASWLVVAVSLQVVLGISTLLLVVPVPLAAAHQAGAVVLFTVALWLVHELRAKKRGEGA